MQISHTAAVDPEADREVNTSFEPNGSQLDAPDSEAPTPSTASLLSDKKLMKDVIDFITENKPTDSFQRC